MTTMNLDVSSKGQRYFETSISKYWFRKCINIDNKEELIRNLSTIISDFAIDVEKFDESLANGTYKILENGLILQSDDLLANQKKRFDAYFVNEVYFGVNIASPQHKYHWRIRYDNSMMAYSQMIHVGVIEADKLHTNYSKLIQCKGISYLWYGGGSYEYQDKMPRFEGDFGFIEPGCYLDIWLDLMSENYNIKFGYNGVQYDWPTPSMGEVKKNTEYRLIVTTPNRTGAIAKFRIIRFHVTYK